MDGKPSCIDDVVGLENDPQLASRFGSFSCESISSWHFEAPRASRAYTTTKTKIGRIFSNNQTSSSEPDNKVENGASGLDKRKHINACFHQYRFFVAVLGGLAVGMMFLLRYNVTVSVLKMVNQTHIYLEEHPNRTTEEVLAEEIATGGEFNWNNEVQQMIMSWYMISYTLPQVPMTKLASILGCRWAIFTSLLVCTVSTLLVPTFAYLGWEYVIFLRMVNGLGASPIQPMLLALLERWLPPHEISLGLSISQTLSTLCLATNPIIVSYLCDAHWSLSFYALGVVTLIFCFIWHALVSDCPDSNMFISEHELNHLKSSIAKVHANDPGSEENHEANLDIYRPKSWLSVFKVPSFYAFILLWCLHNCSFNGFTFVMPTYLIQILKIKITENGLYCSIIQSGCILAVIWPHPILRLLQVKFKFSNIASRRIVISICCSVLAITWLYVGMKHEYQLVLLFLNRCTQNGIDVIVTSTLMLNYARAGLSSLAFSAINTVGNLSVVFSSTLIGWLLDYTGRSNQGWAIVFGGFASVQIFVWFLFCLTISTEPIKFKREEKRVADSISQKC